MDWNEVLSRVMDAAASQKDNLFNFVTLVVSIVAIVVAVRANRLARKANDIQVKALKHVCNQDMLNNLNEAKRKSGNAAS